MTVKVKEEETMCIVMILDDETQVETFSCVVYHLFNSSTDEILFLVREMLAKVMECQWI